jgi:predicted RNA-binding Zn-ribbon protein involved in translation (DUF1610 family)
MMSIVAGHEYFGFLCANPQCGMPILLGEIRPEDLDSKGGVEIQHRKANHTLTCPQCMKTAVYPAQQVRRFRTAEKGSLS